MALQLVHRIATSSTLSWSLTPDVSYTDKRLYSGSAISQNDITRAVASKGVPKRCVRETTGSFDGAGSGTIGNKYQRRIKYRT